MGWFYCFRSRFKEARVLVFGSSAGQLATPESDIDLTVCLPTRAKLIQELKVCRMNREIIRFFVHVWLVWAALFLSCFFV